MKKSLLLCAAALCSLMASAGDGMVTVGANVTVLPASQYDGDVEWKAWTWVYNTGVDYGEPYNEDNPFYNTVFGIPSQDANGNEWYMPEYNMEDIEDENEDTWETITWQEQTAPFSSDATWNGRPSYQWTTSNIMADIYIRRTFTTDQLLSGPVYLACGHDDAPSEYYLNGELIYSVSDGWNNNDSYLLTDEQKALIKLGGEENILAVHVHQNWGGAFADCGLYTKVEGGLEMGYVEPWEGKVLFNNHGGYNNDMKTPSNNPKSPWSRLYEAQEGDEYTFTMEGATDEDNPWMEQIHFKTPIRIEEGRAYNLSLKLTADKDFSNIIVKLCDNNDDDLILEEEYQTITAGEETEVNISFEGIDINDLKIAFDFGGGESGATVTIKEISLTDDEDKELWVGTHYFNYFYMCKADTAYWFFDEEIGDIRQAVTEEEKEMSDIEITYEQADAPEIYGRKETMAWTLPDFDDSMWNDQMMPVGNMGYNPKPASNWPGNDYNFYYEGDGGEGHNTNYWIRRNFTLDKVNERLSYALNVCHDDNYETYVNGHLLQQFSGWTNGKNPKQVHIPAKYLREGKNVIATYIQQNWGGRFYDCGINVEEVNYDECAKLLREAIAAVKVDTLLTNRMKQDVQDLIAEAQHELNTNKDAAELKNFAKELRENVHAIFAYSSSVKTLKDTKDLCQKMDEQNYFGTALDDAVAALDTCKNSNELTPYLNALRVARKRSSLERHTEKYVGCTPEVAEMDLIGDESAPNRYYIYNVGEKLFLGGGDSWGTHAALEYVSNPWMLVQKTDFNEETDEETPAGLRIETFRPNGSVGVMDFLNWGGFVDTYIDNSDNSWELIPVEGKENVYNIARYGQAHEDGTKMLLGFRNGTENDYAASDIVVDTDMKTPELESNQWMFISRDEMLSFIATASEENPVDLSFLITNPGYDQRLSDNDAWPRDNGNIFGRGANYSNFAFESYNSEYFYTTQEMWPEEEDKALPAGTYMLTVQGYYRDGNEQTHLEKVANQEPVAQRALMYADLEAYAIGNDEPAFSMPLMPIHIEANKVPGIGYSYGGMRVPGTYGGQPMAACAQAAVEYFNYGLYQNKLVFTIPEDDPGHISIGIYKNYAEDITPGDWIVFDNWRLKYYGKAPIDEDAINDITSDEIKKGQTEKAIYNLLGQKLTKTQKGINIISGKKVVKK